MPSLPLNERQRQQLVTLTNAVNQATAARNLYVTSIMDGADQSAPNVNIDLEAGRLTWDAPAGAFTKRLAARGRRPVAVEGEGPE